MYKFLPELLPNWDNRIYNSANKNTSINFYRVQREIIIQILRIKLSSFSADENTFRYMKESYIINIQSIKFITLYFKYLNI